MALADFPLKTKYAYLDYVFIFVAGYIDCVQIAGWRVIVDDPDGDDTGRQRTYYKFLDKGNLELLESKVFSSRNHVIWSLKKQGNLYSSLNVACESQTGGYNIFKYLGPGPTINDDQASFGDWVDLAGFDFQFAKFQTDARQNAMPGLVSIASGSNILTGVGTSFAQDLPDGNYEVGYPILINYYDGNPLGCVRFIQSIEDDENMTLTSPVNQDYNDVKAFYIKHTAPQLATGTVSLTSGTKAITGVGTLFTQYEINDNITLLTDSGALTRRVIETITDNTHMTVKTVVNSEITAQKWYDWKKVKSDVEFIFHYHGNGSSPEEIQGEKTLVFDATDFTEAIMPSTMDTKEKFRDVVRSYDADTTTWIDGQPIGRP